MSSSHLLKSKLNLLNAQRLSYSQSSLFNQKEIEELRAPIDLQIARTMEAIEALGATVSIDTSEINKPLH